ncbi:class I SAM-dependent methyltransferase [Sphingomonas trueperi]|uniref:class I SAM-dependent methyltransferase n=1 Tax=Sphingomonas trueperi TaxID=53317 RepID=UPI001C7D7FA8
MQRIINRIKDKPVNHDHDQDSGGLRWNKQRGNVWVDLQPMLDRLFLPFERMLVDIVTTEPAKAVLDIGCGTGAITLALADRLGQSAHCTAVDVSEAMLDHARQRALATGAHNVRFIAGDAQRHRFSPGTFDAVVSRFGVMFFDDPVAAFANIGAAVRTGGTMTCVVWRGREENPFMTAAERAAGPLLGWEDAPEAKPEAPGQFAFASATHVFRILGAAGWRDVDITPADVACSLTAGDLITYSRRMGRVGAILPHLDDALREDVIAKLDAAFADFIVEGHAAFNAACWIIRAKAGLSE